jgi:hypothetical protein
MMRLAQCMKRFRSNRAVKWVALAALVTLVL